MAVGNASIGRADLVFVGVRPYATKWDAVIECAWRDLLWVFLVAVV